MRLLVVLLAVVASVYVLRLRHIPAPVEDDMAQPFLDSRNSATYYYNRLTGVTVSAN